MKCPVIVMLISVVCLGCTDPKPNKPYATITDTSFNIKYSASGNDIDTIVLAYESPEGDISDTIHANGRKEFIFIGRVNEPQVATITIMANNNANQHEIFIENNTLEIIGEPADKSKWIYHGSKVPEDYEEYLKLTRMLSSVINNSDSLLSVYQDNDMNSLSYVYAHKIDSLLGVKRSITASFIKRKSRSPVSLNQLILNFYSRANPDEITKAWNSLDPELQQWPDGRFFYKEILSPAVNTGIGKTAPDFSLPDQNGKTVTLSGLKGKYVLVDFWASWCIPCRKNNILLKDIYTTYKNVPFEVLSVSLDVEERNWLMALAKDKYNWINLIDTAGFQSKVTLHYGVKAIPYSILLDTNRKVLFRNPSIDTLKNILSSL